MTEQCRIRLRLPDGAELEAAGEPEFVREERKNFLALLRAEAQAQEPGAGGALQPLLPAWEAIIESRGSDIQLRTKFKEAGAEADACLVLLAAAQKLLNASKPTAARLARWLRASGYPVQRVDRAIAETLEKGLLLASGSRRARRYELTGPGRAKAFLLAHRLSSLVSGHPLIGAQGSKTA